MKCETAKARRASLSALLATSILWNGVEQAIGFHLLTGCILQSSFPYHFVEIFSLPISIKISFKNLTSSRFSCAVFYMHSLMSQFSSICMHTIIHNVNLFDSFFRYWHRSLNPKKLVDVKFSHLSRNMTMQRTVKLYRLPDVSCWKRIYISAMLLFSSV